MYWVESGMSVDKEIEQKQSKWELGEVRAFMITIFPLMVVALLLDKFFPETAEVVNQGITQVFGG